MDEEFGSLIVTDPDLVDPGIDISGLRTQTDTSLLGNIPDFAGIQYEAFNPNRLSELIRLYEIGLPAVDTPVDVTTLDTPVTGVGGGADSGDGGQATIPDIDLGGNTPEDQRLINEGIGLQIAPGQPVFAPGEMPITQAEMDAENFPELTEQMSEVSIPTPPPFEMPRGGGADIDTFDTTPQDSPITIQNIGPGREVVQPDGTIINIDPLEEQMLQEELRNELEGTDTFTPTLETETIDTAPNIVTAKPPVGVVDPFDGKYTMSTAITPEDTEQSITEKIANFLNVDTDKLNKTAVTSALNLVAGKALDTVIPIATVFNLVKDSFTESPEEKAAEDAVTRQNIEENKVLSEILKNEVTPQDIIDDRGRGQIPTKTKPEPTPVDRPTMADIAGPSDDRDDSPAPPSKPAQKPAAPVYQDAIMRGQTGGGSSPGSSGGCVIATHAVNSGAFTKDTKREAVRWCVKNLHKTWWGEAIRRGYKYYGQKAIDEGKAKNHYQEFKDYVAFGTGKRRTLKTAWTFVYRTVQFFIRGLFNAK